MTGGAHAAEGMRAARSADGGPAGPGGSHHGMLVLASKLRPPPGRPGAVVRQSLLGRLSEDHPWVRLVVISAPAGWGKTCLLRDWRLADTASGTAWMSVDAGDNDPVRFWAHVIAGVTGVSAGFGAAASRVLTVPGSAGLDAVLPMLVNELAALPVPVTLVFDDYHLVSSQEVLRSVAFLVGHLPAGVRLALAARADPDLPLARLRARGEMLEIRADDLRFTEAETAALLNGTLGLNLGPADVGALQRRTEGWAAGLYLAGLSLRGRPEPSAFIQAFRRRRPPDRGLPLGGGAGRPAGRGAHVPAADFGAGPAVRAAVRRRRRRSGSPAHPGGNGAIQPVPGSPRH